MSATSISPSAPPGAVTPRHALLEELIAITLRQVTHGLRELCTTLAGRLLTEDAAMLVDARTMHLRARTAKALGDGHVTLVHLAGSTLEHHLRRELVQLAPQQPVPAPAENALSLVPYEEMDQRVTLGAIARPFDDAHADALAALGVRLARLFDRASLRVNPFRPAVFIAAWSQALQEFFGEEDEGGAAVLLQLLNPACFHDLQAVYGSLNETLERRGVTAPRRVRPAAHDGRRHAALTDRLQRFFASTSGATATGPAGTMGPSASLLAYLESLPRLPPQDMGAAPANVVYLPGIKRGAPAGALSPADEGTIDLLAAVFDAVLHDGAIAPESRDLLQLLQVPVLQAVLADRAFFFDDAHPARRLLELLSQLGRERTRRGERRRDDPEYRAMARSVNQAAADGTGDVTAAFARAVHELEQVLADEEAAAIAAPVAAALQQERTATARRAARDAVSLRLGTGEVVAVVEAFLETRWTDVLTIAYSVEADKPGAVRHATQAMDHLVWSVQPKLTADERRQFLARLPALLAALNKWLDVIRWQGDERTRFFAELADCHASIVRAPLDMAPERRLAVSIEAAQHAAQRRLAQVTASEAAAADDCALAHLARGAWCEFAEEGGARQVRLAWISPMRSLFIFSNGARQEAFSLSSGDLAQRLRAGSVTALQPGGVVDRALAQALASNDPAGSIAA
ncbi:uncharacterized protein DUF1631 [Pseudoduganella lurida]|uniref:Uncharacterized protein DUF1631 n=1 Tax=Pseudoduganella lurida TaxID=1036180 RepID=A0A562RG29_9BURK|nr:DUF1631 family protein [Pseudoduganella lurida]TWI67524.1 uncharacterized protein DUF1631 [Pseudoduganella lurida]